jgi:hypothetical protein
MMPLSTGVDEQPLSVSLRCGGRRKLECDDEETSYGFVGRRRGSLQGEPLPALVERGER